MNYLGLYIHIPFCQSKCGYCDFYSVKASERVQDAYINALLMQMKEYTISTKNNIFDTVFIGGGTPTSIKNNDLLKIIKTAQKNFSISKGCEFTIEANPRTIDEKDLKNLYKTGVNRLSIGLQSIHDNELKALSRIHSFEDFSECYENSQQAGFENINIDLMYGIPHQTLQSFYATLKKVLSIKPAHISVYGLKIEPGTKFYAMRENFQMFLPDEDTERNMYLMCCELLERNGYNQYEISNFCRKGYECKHNLKYWNCMEYIGLGVSAHSYFNNYRFSFKKNIKDYIKSFSYNQNNMENIGVFDLERYNLFDEYTEIKPNERIGEFIMLSFRLKSGIDKNKFARLFHKDFDYQYYNRIQPFIDSGHIIQTTSGYALSREGMFVSNYILSRILDFE